MQVAELPVRDEQEQRLDFHIGNWARWMRSGEHVQGYKHGAAGCVGGGYCGDFDDMVAAVDRRCAVIMDTLITDLPPAQSCAVHHLWINSVYRFRPTHPFQETYDRACQNLLVGMSNKGLW